MTKFERLTGNILKLLCVGKVRVLAGFAVSICRVCTALRPQGCNPDIHLHDSLRLLSMHVASSVCCFTDVTSTRDDMERRRH